ncbi:hypothetical protein ACOME3_007082 [Neoechinorhynchus agilis]
MTSDYFTFSNGDHIPKIGLGTWQSKGDSVYTAVLSALHAGYRHIDTAWAYFNEHEVGKAISKFIDEKSGHVSRQDIFVTSKLWNTFHSKEQVRVGLQESLTALNLNYVDLFLMHWPCGYKEKIAGTSVPFGQDGKVAFSDIDYIETYKAMGELKDEGKIKHIGVSNFSISQMERIAQLIPEYKIEVLQVEAHPLYPQRQIKEYCDSNGIIMQAYASLGAPMRSSRKEGDPVLMENPVITEIATKRLATPPQILIKWCLQTGMVCLPKSVNPERIISNFAAQKLPDLSKDEMQKINDLETGLKFYTCRDAKGHKYDPFADMRK